MSERMYMDDWVKFQIESLKDTYTQAIGAETPTYPELDVWFTDDAHCNSALVVQPKGLNYFVWVVSDDDGFVTAQGKKDSLDSACMAAMRHLPSICRVWHRSRQ